MELSLFSDLTAICSSKQVICGQGLQPTYTCDWSGRLSGQPAVAVLPETTAQVSAILKYCYHHRLPVIVQGGNTGMAGGATPDDSCRQVLLLMQRLSTIHNIDCQARTITAQAGCLLSSLQDAAAAADLFFPLNLGSKGSCQLGGNLATNAGGLNVLRYGNARDLCLGIQAVLPDGSVINNLSGLRKDNSGYDIKNLIIGSEGTLAVITAATMKLFAKPNTIITAYLNVASVVAALAVLQQLQATTQDAVNAFEIMPRSAFDLLSRYQPTLSLPFADIPDLAVLLEISAPPELQTSVEQHLSDFIQQGLINDCVVATSPSQRQHFWQLREQVPVVKARHGQWARTDVALPLSALPDFVAEVGQKLNALSHGLYMIAYGHIGDGNLHVDLRPKDDDPDLQPQLTATLLAVVYEAVARYGGTFSAEHGIGQFKKDLMKRYKDPTILTLMAAIKKVLDPHHILNPGRVLD